MSSVSSPVPEIRAQLLKEEALEALAKAHPIPVQYCRKALVDYHPDPSDDPPHIQYTSAFRKGDFIHFKIQHTSDWWIGRVVGEDSGMSFIPSEDKLRAITEEVCIEESGQKPSTENLRVYQRAPVIRPVVLMGPSSKHSQLTELLQKPLISYMKEKFSGRLTIIKPDFSFLTDPPVQSLRKLEGEVAACGVSMNLIFLDCDASFPKDFEHTNLHPHIVYVQVARQKVLRKLVEQMTKSSRERTSQLEDAYHLYENSHGCSHIVSDSNLDDACLSLELFLESYWAATRSIVLMESIRPRRQSIMKQTTIDASIHQ